VPKSADKLAYDFATIRIVPRVDREEFINAGVIVYCPVTKFLSAAVRLDEERLLALWPAVDLPLIRQHLQAIPQICAGDPNAGPIAALSIAERFHWLVAPRSTIIQISPVHAGICESPALALQQLVARMLPPPA
jgi:hypothetical protein